MILKSPQMISLISLLYIGHSHEVFDASASTASFHGNVKMARDLYTYY